MILLYYVSLMIELAVVKIFVENLWHHLKGLGLRDSDENHPDFGNMKQALETLVQQRLEPLG